MIEKEHKEEIRLVLAAVAMHALLSARTESAYLVAEAAFNLADRMLAKTEMGKNGSADRVPEPPDVAPPPRPYDPSTDIPF